jgi:molybdate transport system ATP-binding protein
LNTSAGQLFLPRIEAPLGSRVRVRILAQDVMISVQKPEQISALNILPCHIISLRPGDGPGMIVELNSGNDRLLARITARSAKRLCLQPDLACYAIVKTLSIRPAEVAI